MKNAILLIILIIACTSANAAPTTWTGAALDGRWETAGNWSGGVAPTGGETVEIPGDAGIITVNASYNLNSLYLKSSTVAGGIRLLPRDISVRGVKMYTGVGDAPGLDITIAIRNQVEGLQGNATDPFGSPVELNARRHIFLDGKIFAGHSIQSDNAAHGGSITLLAREGNIYFTGVCVAGNGGVRNEIGRGGRGGDIEMEARAIDGAGKCFPGIGAGSARNGKTTTKGGSLLTLRPGYEAAGEFCSFEVEPGGQIVMQGLSAGAIHADRKISIKGGGAGTTIDLRGIPASHVVMTAGESICINGNVLLDPGVTLADITEPNAVLSSACPTAFAVNSSAGVGGSISPFGASQVAWGDDKDFTITPAAGYHIVNVTVDGVSVGAVSTYTFLEVTANHTISAQFAAGVLVPSLTHWGLLLLSGLLLLLSVVCLRRQTRSMDA